MALLHKKVDSHPPLKDLLKDPRYEKILVGAIINTIREPLLVLDKDLRVMVASRIFYKDFRVNKEKTLGHELRALGNGQWDIPALRTLLLEILPKKRVVQNYEVEHTFEQLGHRVMLVSAQEIHLEAGSKGEKHILISFRDITESKEKEDESQRLLAEHKLLLREARHRIANNLQLVTSILLLGAESSSSEEVRTRLTDTHNRVMSIAMLEKHLQPVGIGEYVDIHQYLTTLCKILTASMINDSRHIELKVEAAHRQILSSEALFLGLITTELVINALKYAFRGREEGKISVRFQIYKESWRLSVIDNGVGITSTRKTPGMGTGLVEGFASQLKAKVTRESNAQGTTVSVEHGIDEKA